MPAFRDRNRERRNTVPRVFRLPVGECAHRQFGLFRAPLWARQVRLMAGASLSSGARRPVSLEQSHIWLGPGRLTLARRLDRRATEPDSISGRHRTTH